MNSMRDDSLDDYYAEAESWADDRDKRNSGSRKIAWIVAGIAALIALVEAIALVSLVPLRRDVPYTLLVDRQTGYVQAINPLSSDTLTADAALTRSFLVQYIIARESFDADVLQENYRKVGLWSADDARQRYVAQMQSSNSQSPLSYMPNRGRIDVDIASVSSLSPDSAMVRFTTTRRDPGSSSQLTDNWAAVVSYRFSDADMSAEDRLTNPLGFQVTRYRRDAETLPEEVTGEPTPRAATRPADPSNTEMGISEMSASEAAAE